MKKRLLQTLLVLLLLFGLMAAVVFWGWSTTSGASFILNRASPYIPGDVQWASVEGSFSSELGLHGLSYEDESVQIELEHLAVAIRPSLFPFAVHLPMLHTSGLRITPKDSGSDSEPLDLEGLLASLVLPFGISFDSVVTKNSSLASEDGGVQLPGLQLSGSWQREIQLTSLRVQEEEREWLASLQISLVSPHALQGLVEQESESPIRVSFEGTPGELGVQFRLPIEDDIQLDGTATLALGSQLLGFSDLEVQARNSSFQAEGHGEVDLVNQVLEGDFEWIGFQWPLESAQPDLASPRGSIKLAGAFDDWRLSGTCDLRIADMDADQIRMEGSGNTQSAKLNVAESRVLDGTMRGTASVTWVEQLDWQADFSVEQVRTDVLFAEYPGRISASATAKGEDGIEHLQVDIRKLDGMVRGVSLEGSGAFSLDGPDWHLDSVELRSGDSMVMANGGPRSPDGLALNLQSVELAIMAPDFSGLINGNIRLDLNDEAFRYEASLDATNLDLAGIQIDRLQVRALPGNASHWTAEGIRSSDFELLHLEIDSRGAEPFEDLSIEARLPSAQLSAQLVGKVDGWESLANARWRGELKSLDLRPEEALALALDQPALLTVAASDFELGRSCLIVVDESRLCISARWAATDSFEAKASLNEFPLASLDGLANTEWRVNQVANGQISVSGRPGQAYSGQGHVQFSPGQISVEDNEDLAVPTGPGVVNFEIDQGSLRNGTLDLELPGNGLIDVDFNIPDFRQAGDSPLTGTIRVNLADIGPLWRLLPVFDTIEGSLNLDTQLQGTITTPRLGGKAHLSNGVFIHEATGLTLEDINIGGEISNYQATTLAGTFRAGEGQGNLEMNVDLSNLSSPEVLLDIEGKNLALIDMADLQLAADPDVRLAWQNDQLELTGRVFIPDILLSPTRIPPTRQTESPDVRIVRGNPTVNPPKNDDDDDIAIFGKLEVELGSRARIDLDVAELAVTGRSAFEWQGQSIPVANGEFNVSGEILAFGQRLEVRNGRVGFPNVPADNPHLNIRAERQIYGNSQVQRAGLMIGGTIKQMVMEAYTVPLTTKERAQTLLVTGSDFNYEQGVGAVSLGTYILPRLYVSYGIGVFEDGNVVSARYDLSRRFGVKATSGEKDTGVDLTYTIDR